MDDEESIRELVSDSLGSRGCWWIARLPPNMRWNLSIRNSYDVILCDLNLESVPDGQFPDSIFTTASSRILRHAPRPRPAFIFMTGDLVDAAIGEQAGRQGNHFLQKPFRIAELLSILNELPSAAILQPKDSAS